MRNVVRVLAVISFALSLAACGGVDSPSSATAEDFSGTLAPLGTANRTFSVSKTGEMQVTLQSLTPRPVVGFVGIAIGTPVGTDCAPALNYIISQAAIGQQYSMGQVQKGTYCILVADSNAILTTSSTFTVHFLHP